MHEFADRLAGPFVRAEDNRSVMAAEFEARLADSSRLAFRVAFSVLRQQQDAEDVAQEAFARAFVKFGQLRDRERFRAWLVRMTWRLALDHRRGARRRAAREAAGAAPVVMSTEGLVPPSAPDQETALIAGERRTRLWDAIDRLPEGLRVVIVLAAIEEHGVKDVAALVGLPEGTVKSRLFEARRQLQEMLA